MLNVRFDSEKALEAILYVASKAPIADLYHVGKILYFADCAHLEQYGRMICGDTYHAMKDGPVASGTFDLLKIARGDGQYIPAGITAQKIQSSLRFDGWRIVQPKREADEDFFSDSDIACIDAAIEKYGEMSFEEIREISHDGAWNAAWSTSKRNAVMSLELIAAQRENSELLLSYLNSEG